MTLLQEVIEQFGLPETPKFHNISREKVVLWMTSKDIEVLGALYAFLMNTSYAKRVVPALTFAEYEEFLTHYFERCLQENAEGAWSHGRYSAAWDLAGWFSAVWKDNKIDKMEKVKIKNWLGEVYKKSDEQTRQCIVNGTLEHLFENQEIVSFFADWKNNPVLASAYVDALQWVAKQ